VIVELDVGNTRVKWRVLDREGVRMEGGFWPREEGWAGLAELPDGAETVRLACVADDRGQADLVAAIERRWGVRPGLASVHAEQRGLSNGYDDPSQMGVDRWLALLAAWEATEDGLCVVDCGSAVTIDLVNAQGRHLGGYILPGLRLMARSLLESTGRIRFEDAEPADSLDPGRCTAEAVRHGAVLAAVGAVAAARGCLPDSAVCYLTGGDAPLMRPHLAGEVRCVPELVMDGLHLNLKEPE
jgi:type III pantothenate kinase